MSRTLPFLCALTLAVMVCIDHKEGAAAGIDFNLSGGLHTHEFRQHIILAQNQVLAVEKHRTGAQLSQLFTVQYIPKHKLLNCFNHYILLQIQNCFLKFR